jgi:hypothetical protein
MLRRVTRITPAEALRLLRVAAELEREGRPAATRRAIAYLGTVSKGNSKAGRDVPAAVAAAFRIARESATWQRTWNEIWMDDGNPRRSAEAAGGFLSVAWDTERTLDGIAGALAVEPFLAPSDLEIVLAPWNEMLRNDEATVQLGELL